MNYSLYNTCFGTTENYSKNLSNYGSLKRDNTGYTVSFKLPEDTTYSFIYDPLFGSLRKCTHQIQV